MIKRHDWCAAVIILLWLIWPLAGTLAQSNPQTNDPDLRRMRQTNIQEAELVDSTDPDPAQKKIKEQDTVGDRKSERRANANLRAADEERVEVEKNAIRPRASGTGALPLLARITAKTSPQRAASLKLVDEGRKALGEGEYKQALATFERSIAVDATNPYSHYFMARAHFFLANHRESFNFLDVAESLLGWHKLWLAEIYVLKGRNAAAMGFLGRADANYLQALRFDPYNRLAFQRLTNIHTIMAGAELPAP